jgi:N-acetylmuramoyl-L-alanine amidase
MNFKQLFLTKNDCYKAAKLITPKGIMLHSTGANNPNLRRYIGPDDGYLGQNLGDNHWNQSKPDGREVCVHAFIGKLADGSIATYQTLPFNFRGWHCGGAANDTHIGFEICEDDLTDKFYFEKIYKESIELCSDLCKQYNMSPSNIICHCEGFELGVATNHSDVMHWFPKFNKSMDTFRADVKNLLNENNESSKPDDNLTLLNKLAKKINLDKDYWLNVLDGKTKINLDYLKILFERFID